MQLIWNTLLLVSLSSPVFGGPMHIVIRATKPIENEPNAKAEICGLAEVEVLTTTTTWMIDMKETHDYKIDGGEGFTTSKTVDFTNWHNIQSCEFLIVTNETNTTNFCAPEPDDFWTNAKIQLDPSMPNQSSTFSLTIWEEEISVFRKKPFGGKTYQGIKLLDINILMIITETSKVANLLKTFQKTMSPILQLIEQTGSPIDVLVESTGLPVYEFEKLSLVVFNFWTVSSKRQKIEYSTIQNNLETLTISKCYIKYNLDGVVRYALGKINFHRLNVLGMVWIRKIWDLEKQSYTKLTEEAIAEHLHETKTFAVAIRTSPIDRTPDTFLDAKNWTVLESQTTWFHPMTKQFIINFGFGTQRSIRYTLQHQVYCVVGFQIKNDSGRSYITLVDQNLKDFEKFREILKSGRKIAARNANVAQDNVAYLTILKYPTEDKNGNEYTMAQLTAQPAVGDITIADSIVVSLDLNKVFQCPVFQYQYE